MSKVEHVTSAFEDGSFIIGNVYYFRSDGRCRNFETIYLVFFSFFCDKKLFGEPPIEDLKEVFSTFDSLFKTCCYTISYYNT